MYSKTVQKESYSKDKFAHLKVLFEDLEQVRKSPAVKAYLKKRKAELKG
ncbi:MAG TPA: hypothetical protein VFF13_05940 [archaeon]|nr:hypothetical protein [archaeon]